MLIQYVLDELAVLNNQLMYLSILGAPMEQVEKLLHRREYLLAVIRQFEEV